MLVVSSEINGIIKYDVNQPNNNIVTFLLVYIGFNAAGLSPLSYTEAPIAISFDSNVGTIPSSRTYSPDNTLKSVSPPKSEGEIERDLFEIVFGDPTFSLAGTLSLQSTGVPVEIHLGFRDSDGTVVQDALPVYSGQIASWSSGVDGEEPVITINCTGPLTKLQQVTNRLTTKDSQQAKYPSDTCFDFSFDTENEAALNWGPAGGND